MKVPRFRVPEIVLGALLAAAVFAIVLLGLSPSQQPPPGTSPSLWMPTDSIGLYTLILAIVSIAQGFFLLSANRTARVSAEAAKKSAETADLALTKLERPYLYCSNVGRLQTEVIEDREEGYGDLLMTLTYSVANYGKLPAIITRIRAGLTVSKSPRIPDELYASHSLVMSPILAAGDARHDIATWLIWEDHGRDEDGDFIPVLGERSLSFRIIIEYRGPFSEGHEMCACWRYNESTGHFVPMRDPKYTSEK